MEDADGDEEEEMEQNENHGEDGAPLDDYVQEANTLELPEDMNLDTSEETQEPMPDEDIDMEDAEEPIEEPTLDREGDDTTSDAEDVDADESAAPNDGTGMQQNEPLDEAQDANHTVAQPELHAGQGNESGASQGATASASGQGSMEIDVADRTGEGGHDDAPQPGEQGVYPAPLDKS